MNLADIAKETPESRGAERLIAATRDYHAKRPLETPQDHEARRRREREDEMRREDLAVEILVAETRRIYVCAFTGVQFDLFRRKLDHACRRWEIPLKDVRRVGRFGDELRGIDRGRCRIVLLESWERNAARGLEAQVNWLTRDEEPLTT